MKRQVSLHFFRNRLLLLLGVVALCGALVACSRVAAKPDPVEPVDPKPVEPVTPTVAPEVAMEVEQSLRIMLQALSDPAVLVAPPSPLAGETGAPALDLNCPVVSTGDDTDADDDNYSVAETRTCDKFPVDLSPLGVILIDTKLVLRDHDDSDAASGVEATADSAFVWSVHDNPVFSVVGHVELAATKSGSGAGYGIAYEGSVDIVYPFSRIDSDVDLAGATLAGSFQAGTLTVPQGTYRIATQPADCDAVDESMREECRMAVQDVEAGEFELTVQSSGIEYDAACETVFTGGYFDLRAFGSVLKSTYDGCGPASITVNGQPVPPPEPPEPSS